MSIETELAALHLPAPTGMAEGVALGTGLAEGFDLFQSPIGTVVVTFNEEGVTSLMLQGSSQPEGVEEGRHRPLIRATAPSAWARFVPDAIESGNPGKVPVDLRRMSRFQERVLRTTASIPKGEVRPYGWVAREMGTPGAVRAVGTALSRNPIPLMIPCHRVVRSDGTIGEYSLGGPEVKTRLLEHEGAGPGRLAGLANAGVKLQGNRSTGIYCHPTCHALLRSRTDHVVGFRSAREAEDAGFRACLRCRPV